MNRRAGRTDVEIEVEVQSNVELYAGLTKNIGLGGVFVATPRPRSVGERVALKFMLPGGDQPIAVESEVRWVSEPGISSAHAPGMGLRFVNLAFEQSMALQRFLSDRERAVELRPRSS